MTTRRAALACAAAAALGGGLAGCGAGTAPRATTAGAAAADVPATVPGAVTAPPTDAGAAAATPAAKLRAPLAFHVRRRTQLRARPGGRVLAALSTTTEFKSPRILAVVARKPGWVLVRTSVRRHRVGWLPLGAGALFSQPRTIVIDLSERTLAVYHRGRRTDVYRVAIGTKATPTPRGRFAVTDRLTVKPGTPYGCCILALTAHQPQIAQGWGGGDRVAIHATPDTWAIGHAVSHGCVRATNKALHELMRHVRLGTPVWIHG